MAITIKGEATERRLNNAFALYGTFSADNSYPVGGYPSGAIHPRIKSFSAAGGTYIWTFDPLTKKIKAMKVNTGTGRLVEETAATNLSTEINIPYTAIIILE